MRLFQAIHQKSVKTHTCKNSYMKDHVMQTMFILQEKIIPKWSVLLGKTEKMQSMQHQHAGIDHGPH